MKLIFTLHGRIGNRFYIISAMIYAMQKYNIECYVYIPDYARYWVDYECERMINFNEFIQEYIIKEIPNDCIVIKESDINYHEDNTIFLEDLINQYKNSNKTLLLDWCFFQTNKYFHYYRNSIMRLFKYENSNISNYRKIISNNDVFVSVRRGDYFNWNFYVLSADYYIDVYNKNFKGKNVYISSDDIEWCKENLTIDKFDECNNLFYLENLDAIELFHIGTFFENYICANSSFSAACELNSRNTQKSFGVINLTRKCNRNNIFSKNCITYDIINKKYINYLDDRCKDVNNIFDEIHCILFLDNKERVKNVQQVFNSYSINNVKYTYTCKKPIYHNVRESYKSLIHPYWEMFYNMDNETYNRLFDNVLNHYNIIKNAYKRNLNSVLVFEDDINICVNKNIFDKIIKNIPNDYDILKFYNSLDENRYELTTEDNIKYIKKFDVDRGVYSCVMVAYSRKGMKEYLDIMEKNGIAGWDVHYEDCVANKSLNVYRLSTYFINPELKSITCG